MGVGWLRPRPAALIHVKTRYPFYRRLGVHQDRSERVRKISPPPEFDSRTAQSVASRHTDEPRQWSFPDRKNTKTWVRFIRASNCIGRFFLQNSLALFSCKSLLPECQRCVKYNNFNITLNFVVRKISLHNLKKSKAVPFQAWSGPEGSRKLRFPDFMTTAQGGGKVVSLTHRPLLPPGNFPGTHFC